MLTKLSFLRREGGPKREFEFKNKGGKDGRSCSPSPGERGKNDRVKRKKDAFKQQNETEMDGEGGGEPPHAYFSSSKGKGRRGNQK